MDTSNSDRLVIMSSTHNELLNRDRPELMTLKTNCSFSDKGIALSSIIFDTERAMHYRLGS